VYNGGEVVPEGEMTAEDIRRRWERVEGKEAILVEIAAQLAECNENWLKVQKQNEVWIEQARGGK